MQTYRDLIVWQKAIIFVASLYRTTASFPRDELYGLTNQMRRAAVSIPSNLAEGYSRKHRLEYAHFVRISFSSGAELETQLILSQKLGFLSENDYQNLSEMLTEIMKMLNRLIQVLEKVPA